MLMERARKCQPQYIANVALKVNVKLGGVNSTTGEPLFKRSRWMLIGGDISMPNSSALRRNPPPPSVAAMSGTWDKDCTAYTAVATMQDCSEANRIVYARPMLNELALRYRLKNGNKFPESVIFYRDGTSEGEFGMVIEGEVQDIRNALPGVKITVIISIKRHHTRIFPDGYGTKLG
jgi:eukaryotic translation initiation factor 2C